MTTDAFKKKVDGKNKWLCCCDQRLAAFKSLALFFRLTFSWVTKVQKVGRKGYVQV